MCTILCTPWFGVLFFQYNASQITDREVHKFLCTSGDKIMASLIKKPGNDNWYVQYKVNGRRKRVSTRTDKKKIALEVLNRYKVEEAKEYNDLPTTLKRYTLQELSDKYLEHCKATRASRWAHNKGLLLKNFILPFFGESTALKNITASKIEDYQRFRLKSVKPRTVNIDTHHALIAMLRKAVDWEMMPETAVPKVKKLKEEEGRLRFLSKDEMSKLRETAEQLSPELEAYVMLELCAGLRAGEALALRWQDINFDQRIITIAPRQDWTPKTGKTRVIPMNKDLFKFLKARNESNAGSEQVIGVTYDGIKKRFRRLVHLSGLPIDGDNKVTAHTLRHSFASHLVMAGTPLYTVATLLGHSSTETTRLYAHLAPDHLQDAVNGLNFG